VKDILDALADQVLQLDPDELKGFLPDIQSRMASAEDNEDWSRAVISFFLVNALSFRENLRQRGLRPVDEPEQRQPGLRVVK
jgi:hypothetical protein